MKESGLWQYVRNGMLLKWHVTRIESSSGNGVPDITFGVPSKNGWLELKYTKEWPVRPTTKVKLPLRPEQKLWIKNRGNLSGDVWVLFKIYQSYFLLNWEQAIRACDGYTQDEWTNPDNVDAWWGRSINFQELYNRLAGS